MSQIESMIERTAVSEDVGGPVAPGSAPGRLYAAAPVSPTPLSEIVAALRGVNALHGLAEDEYEWLAMHATERGSTESALVFEENAPAHHLTFILQGEVYVHRRNSGSVNLFIGRTGQITGKLPFSRMKTWGGEGWSSGAVWLLDIHESRFPALLLAIPSMAQLCVSTLLDRGRDFARADLQAEKLMALGKLAANLSHELNNPASAAQSAATRLSSKVDRVAELCRLGRLFEPEEELERYLEWTERALAVGSKGAADDLAVGNSLMESDREEELADWLERHRVPNAWAVAPALARANMPIGLLDELASRISVNTLPSAVTSFASSLDARSMVDAVADSSNRIFRIISAIKDYSYMDQAPIQDVDLVQSVENALALLHPRLREMTVARDYDVGPATVTGYGAELSQVWTALIENAIDATGERGTLKIRVGVKGEMAVVEIWDDGAGIDPALSSRIFEPFFTTKPLGEGLGLGLDTVRRIVGKHFGTVTVQSAPHDTCFQVRLPLHQPQIY
jgi:signal transduction histidine kinase